MTRRQQPSRQASPPAPIPPDVWEHSNRLGGEADSAIADLSRSADRLGAADPARQQLEAELKAARLDIVELRCQLQAQRRKHQQLHAAAADADVALAQLHKAASNVAASRRWQWGNRLGDVADRLVGRRRELAPTAHFERELQAARTRIAASRAAATNGRGPAPTAGVQPHQPYLGFASYLRYAATDPVIMAPFDKYAQRVLDMMDIMRRRAATAAAARQLNVPVSVIMPTFNRAGTLAAAVRSVLDQTYTHLELIIADDGSTDATAAVIASFDDDRIIYLPTDRNAGVAAARNRALAAATGDIIAYLDSDNTMLPDFLMIMVAALIDAPVPVAYCAQQVWETRHDGGRELGKVRFGPFNRALLEHRNYIDQNAFVHRRDLVETYGGFNESLPRLVDWELLLRYTADTGAQAVPCVLSVYEAAPAGRVSTDLAHDGVIAAVDGCWQPEAELSVPPTVHATEAPIVPAPGIRPRPGTARPVATIIPSFEAHDCLQLCIERVLATTDHLDHELIVVDNGSSEPVRRLLGRLAAEHPTRIRVELADRNYGFTWAVNRGIELAGDRDVTLLNNDAVVTSGWYEAFFEVLDTVDDVGLIVPRQTLLPETKTMRTHVPYAVTSRELDVSISAHHRSILDAQFDVVRGFMQLSFAPFFCVYIPRHTIDELGPLDVETGPHFSSDWLYSELMAEVGQRKMIYTPHAKLYHFLQQSTAVLKSNDPDGYRMMVVANDWKQITAHLGSDGTSVDR